MVQRITVNHQDFCTRKQLLMLRAANMLCEDLNRLARVGANFVDDPNLKEEFTTRRNSHYYISSSLMSSLEDVGAIPDSSVDAVLGLQINLLLYENDIIGYEEIIEPGKELMDQKAKNAGQLIGNTNSFGGLYVSEKNYVAISFLPKTVVNNYEDGFHGRMDSKIKKFSYVSRHSDEGFLEQDRRFCEALKNFPRVYQNKYWAELYSSARFVSVVMHEHLHRINSPQDEEEFTESINEAFSWFITFEIEKRMDSVKGGVPDNYYENNELIEKLVNVLDERYKEESKGSFIDWAVKRAKTIRKISNKTPFQLEEAFYFEILPKDLRSAIMDYYSLEGELKKIGGFKSYVRESNLEATLADIASSKQEFEKWKRKFRNYLQGLDYLKINGIHEPIRKIIQKKGSGAEIHEMSDITSRKLFQHIEKNIEKMEHNIRITDQLIESLPVEENSEAQIDSIINHDREIKDLKELMKALVSFRKYLVNILQNLEMELENIRETTSFQKID